LQGPLWLLQELKARALSSLERPLLLHACFVNRGAGAALAIHPTQTIQGNGHSHCRKKVSSTRTEFRRSSTPRQTNRPRRHTGRSCLSALPLDRSARLSHVELNLHTCASGRKRAEGERHFQALRKADDLTCFTSLHRAVSVSGNVLGPDGERTWSYGRFWHYQSRGAQLRYVPIAVPNLVRWNDFHTQTAIRVLSNCDVDLSTAAVISADMEVGNRSVDKPYHHSRNKPSRHQTQSLSRYIRRPTARRWFGR